MNLIFVRKGFYFFGKIKDLTAFFTTVDKKAKVADFVRGNLH